MSALDEIKKKLNHELTYIEYLIIENIDRETTSTINGAAAELADYELRLDLLAKGATWEHEENERLKDENAALRARVEAKDRALKVAEWGRMTPSGEWACPVCKMLENHGHADNCELAAALRGEA